MLETYMKLCVTFGFSGKKSLPPGFLGKKTFTAKTGKMGQKLGFFNLKRNLVINFHWIYSIMEICSVPTEILFWEESCFWDMGQNAHCQWDSRIFKSVISLEQIDETASFFACWYKFTKIKS